MGQVLQGVLMAGTITILVASTTKAVFNIGQVMNDRVEQRRRKVRGLHGERVHSAWKSATKSFHTLPSIETLTTDRFGVPSTPWKKRSDELRADQAGEFTGFDGKEFYECFFTSRILL
jgi:hypothetical protein